MNCEREYQNWLDNADRKTADELLAAKDELRDRFYKELEFGTGGLRGVLGAGTNRMNKYVVGRATLGLAEYINKNAAHNKSVVIAYDSRNYSREFAETAANVLISKGIKAYVFDELRPTPELSFAVRYLGTTAGIVITASHNPAKYNGYKIYWSDGGQIPPDIASAILSEINKKGYFEAELSGRESEITWVGKEIDEQYLNNVYMQSVNKDVDKNGFKLVYTPMHGSGNKLVRGILEKARYKDVIVVKEQELPDGNFPTVKSPNPEDKEGFTIAIEYAEKNNVDLIIATDPDSDRMGIAVRNKNGEYVTMTGNQVGVMLLDYILSQKTPPKNGAAVTTIVSTKMADAVCKNYGVKLIRTLTGFKYIGEKIHEFEESGENTFLFGFEESYGYLAGTYARDKDAVVASMLTAEMACFYSAKGMTLLDVMDNLYKKFGGYYEELESITLEGENGMENIKRVMTHFRYERISEVGGTAIESVTDYLGKTDLPKSDVLRFCTANGLDFIIRPSGTEPKLKIYYLAEGKTYDEAKEKAQKAKAEISKIIKRVIA